MEKSEGKKQKKVYIFKMKRELNDNESIVNIQNDYFENELKDKNKNNGRYRVPHRNNGGYIHKNDINEEDIILFSYGGKYIATARIKKKSGQYFYEIDKKDSSWSFINWEDELEKTLDHYYQFDITSIHKIPPVDVSVCNEFFEGNAVCQSAICKVLLIPDYEENFNNLLNTKKNWSLVNKNSWDKLVKDITKPSLLKEISLYNYENIHTNFLSNFLLNDNVYGLNDLPFQKFLELLINRAKGNNRKYLEEAERIVNEEIKKGNTNYYKVYPQKKYCYDRRSFIPDITITINDKYHIIVEAKVCAEENIYEEELRQCELYYNTLEKYKNNEKYIYVFLTMHRHNEIDNNYVKITFNDIYENVYKEFSNKDRYGILFEYLRSFQYLCDKEKFNFDIDEIPPIYIIDKEKINKEINKLKEDIDNICSFKIPSNIKQKDLFAYRYLLVLIYNLNYKGFNELVKKCYDNFVWHS